MKSRVFFIDLFILVVEILLDKFYYVNVFLEKIELIFFTRIYFKYYLT